MMRYASILILALSLVACHRAKPTDVSAKPIMGSLLNPLGPAGGALSGNYPNPGLAADAGILNGLAAGGVLSATYPNPGLLSDAGILSSLTASGDLSGTYPGPTVAKINGASVPAAGSLTTGNVLQVSGSSTDTYAAVNLAGGAGYVTGSLPDGNQSAQTCSGDVTGNTGATVVTKATGTSPILIQPTAGSTTGSFDTTGAIIGKTASSNMGMRIAPLIGSETTFAGIWVGSAATSPTSGNYDLALAASGGTSFLQTHLNMGTSNLTMSGTATIGTLSGASGTPLKLAATGSAIACSTGGTQTISAAQGGTPGLSVTSGTLSSDCTLDFGTNAVTGWYYVDVSGSITLNGHNLVFKNGTQSQTYSSIPAKGLIQVWTHGTNTCVTAP